MAYNPALYYPQNYQQYPLYAQPVQAPAQQPASRLVEVFPVDGEQAVIDFPLAVGSTGVFFAKDDSFVAVKVSGVNGQGSLDFFDRRPPAPPAPVFDPGAYVTKAELDKRLEALLAAHSSKVEEAEA